MKLTDRRISALALPPGKTDHIEWDDDVPGYGVRLREGGARGFVFQYKVGDQHRRMNLGAVSAVKESNARKTAANLYHRVKLGEDPAGDKADAKIKAAETFGAFTKPFLERQRGRLRPSSYEDMARHVLVYSRPLHGLQLAKIERRDVAAVLTAVAKDSGATTANRTRSSLSSFFAYARMEDETQTNPVIGTARYDEVPRERVLAPAELRVIWTNLGDDDFGVIMKLLMLTGQRAGEIANLRWSEISDGTIVLPGTRTKNHRAHIVPLSAPARAILEARKRYPSRDLVFGKGQGGFSGWSQARGKLERQITETTSKSLTGWRPHDLRRIVASGLQRLGVRLEVTEAVLNHKSGSTAGIVGVYQRHDYAAEKAAALNQWADHLMKIVTNAQVQ